MKKNHLREARRLMDQRPGHIAGAVFEILAHLEQQEQKRGQQSRPQTASRYRPQTASRYNKAHLNWTEAQWDEWRKALKDTERGA